MTRPSIDPGRRQLLGFLAAAPFIVKASSLMPVRLFVGPPDFDSTHTWVIVRYLYAGYVIEGYGPEWSAA